MTLSEKLINITENIPKVYEAGLSDTYDNFWDAYQQNGERTQYNSAFAGVGWNNKTFKPKYDIKPLNAYQMFRDSEIEGDLVEILKENGVILDTSNSTNFNYTFQLCEKITHIGVIDLRGATQVLDSTFLSAKNLVTIDKLCFTESIRPSDATFRGLEALENIEIEGIIGYSFNFRDSKKLSAASVGNIVGHLSPTVLGQTASFASEAIDNYIAVRGSDMWDSLIALFPNWTFATV